MIRAVGRGRAVLVSAWLAVAAGAMAPAGAAGLPLGAEDPRTGERARIAAGPAALHVVFFATWCPPCRAELDALADLEARWGDRGYRLVIVAVQARHDAARLKRFIEEERPPGRLLFDAQGEAQKALAASHVPTHVLFDHAGREVARSAALDDGLTRAVEQLLVRPRPAGGEGSR